MEFTCKLAGRVIRVHALFDSTRDFCRDYLTEGEPDFTLHITQSDIQFEREKSARQDALDGIPVRPFSDAYLETLAVYRKIVDWMLGQDILLFHGSVVAVDGKGYLFTAKSGTGKSTHTRLWREVFGDRAVMINDDKPLLQVTDRGIVVHGTPWNGKHRLSTNTSVPLEAICILERGQENRILPITPKEALPMLFQQSYRTPAPQGMVLLMDLLDRIANQVSFYRLSCNMEREAALVSYQGMQNVHHAQMEV